MCLFKERIRQCLAPAFPYTHLRPRAIRAVVGADFGLAAKSRFPDRSGGLVANVSSFIEDGIADADLQAEKQNIPEIFPW